MRVHERKMKWFENQKQDRSLSLEVHCIKAEIPLANLKKVELIIANVSG